MTCRSAAANTSTTKKGHYNIEEIVLSLLPKEGTIQGLQLSKEDRQTTIIKIKRFLEIALNKQLLNTKPWFS